MFTEIKNRDAWGTIRGFVYQVDLTILRWINLRDNEILELERGEDIDIVTNDFEQQEISRELEQIKYRDNNISLNQVLILDILLNFVIHRKNNPAQKIYFRFVSNTNYCKERPALFLDGKSGVEVWKELSGFNQILEDDSRLVIIKKHLQKKIEENLIDDSKIIPDEKKEAQESWKYFLEFIENNSNLIQLIKDFEWSLVNDDYDDISKSIKSKLIDLNIATDFTIAERLYSRLFLFVFKLLSIKGIKQIDKQKFQEQISLPELNQTDQNLLNFIEDIIGIFDKKIEELENKTIKNSVEIESLNKSINSIYNFDTVYESRLKYISITPPSVIKNGTPRKEKVLEIVDLFKEKTWISFQDINGTGKSQLARLIIDKYETSFWLDLRSYNQNIEASTLLIETFLSIISNYPIINDRNQWLENVVRIIPKNAIIIINDLPKVDNDTALSYLLFEFTNKLAFSEIKLLTTSNFKIPDQLSQLINQNLFVEYYDFIFSDKEIIEYLINSSAPDFILKHLSLISAVSYRNPRLVSAIIQYLKSINWGKDSLEVFEVLLKKEFSADVTENVQESIKKFIKDESSKELLYRLSLINWDFNLEIVKAISNIEDKIIHPNEKLQDLTNVWIQKQGETFYNSPLIYNIGEKNLPLEIIRNINLTIGHSILSTKRIDQVSAFRSIISFIKGDDFNNAGLVLLTVFQSVKTKAEIENLQKWGYLAYWHDLEIPNKMSLIIRIYILNEQIRLFSILGKDTTIFYDRILKFTEDKTIEITESVFIRIILLSNYQSTNLTNYWIYFQYILDHFKEIAAPFRNSINADIFTGFLWISIQYNWSERDVMIWIELINKIETEFNIEFFDNAYAQTSISILMRKLVDSENSKAENEQNWISKIELFKFMISYFNERNLEVLSSEVEKAIITYEFQISENKLKSEEITLELTNSKTSDIARYLLCQNIGKLFYNDKNNKKSQEWLSKALEINCTNQIDYIETLIYGASAFSLTDSKKAVEYCERAVYLENSIEKYDELDFIQVLSELGIAYWIDNNYEQSFLTFEDVVNRLFKAREDKFGEYWIRLFSWTGHALGYISPSAGGLPVPTEVRDGSGEYIKPYQGFITFNTKDLTEFYKSKNDPFMMAHLAMFADNLNNIAKSYHWSLRAFDLARKNGDQNIFLMISSVCGQYSLINFKVEEAFESYLLFSAVSSHLKGKTYEKFEQLNDIQISDLLSNKPSEKWNEAEENLLLHAVIPLFIMILTSNLNKDENTNDRINQFNKMLQDYIPNASDKALFDIVFELCNNIIEKNILEQELIERGNYYGNNNLRNIQIICLIGYIFTTKDRNKQLTQIINITPYLKKIYGITKSVNKFIIVPFIKYYCLNIFKDEFVGGKDEFDTVINNIENIDISNRNAIQLMLQPVVTLLELKISEDRNSWLYNFEEI